MSLTTVAPVLLAPNKPQQMLPVVVDDPGPDEVRVRMVASGVCHSCLHAADGSHTGVPTPIVLGDEGSGVVDAVGPGVDQLQPGDHVIVSWAPSCGRCRHCGVGRPGLCAKRPPVGFIDDGTTRFHLDSAPLHHYGPATNAPYIVIRASAAIPIDRQIPLDVAALVGCAVTTGVGAVLNTAQVRPGETVAVVGVGGVGLNAVQGAAIAGANPIVALDVLASKLEYARQFGATDVIDLSAGSVEEEMRQLGIEEVHTVIVAAGAVAAIEVGWQMLGPRGTCVVVGAPPTGSVLQLDPSTLVGGERRLVGSRLGSSNPVVEFPRLLELFRAGKLDLNGLVTKRYALAEVNEAYADLAAGRLARGLILF